MTSSPEIREFDKALGIDGWNAGLLTKDEAREKLGMPPALVGGDVYKTQFSDVYIREDDEPGALHGGSQPPVCRERPTA